MHSLGVVLKQSDLVLSTSHVAGETALHGEERVLCFVASRRTDHAIVGQFLKLPVISGLLGAHELSSYCDFPATHERFVWNTPSHDSERG